MTSGWCSLYITHVAMSSVGMATLGELRWAGRLTCLTWSSARLGTVHGNLRHKKCWAYCWVACLFSSFTFPQANQFTFYRMNALRLSWESLLLHLSDRQGWASDKNPNLTSVCMAGHYDGNVQRTFLFCILWRIKNHAQCRHSNGKQ